MVDLEEGHRGFDGEVGRGYSLLSDVLAILSKGTNLSRYLDWAGFGFI